MRILFIKPPNYALYHEINRFYPLGLAYLASSCREAGHEVDIFDSLTYFEDNKVLYDNEMSEGQRNKKKSHPALHNIIRWGSNFNRIKEYVKQFFPDVVGITSMHSAMYDTAYQVIEIVKTIIPQSIVIVGGAHASVAYEHILNHTNADYVLMGEGEESIVQLLNCIDNKEYPDKVDGIAYRKGNEMIVNPKQEWINNLDKLAFPAAELLELHKYDAISMVSGRGCLHNCSFCGVGDVSGRRCRLRSVQNVLQEIKYYYQKFGIKKFHFEDDNFLFDKERALEILRSVKAVSKEISISFPNGLTITNLSEEVINELVDLNLENSFIGLETTHKDLLQDISKNFTSLEKVKSTVDAFRKRGVNIYVSLIIGFPKESIEMMIDDIKKLIMNDVFFGTANPYYPIPKTKNYYECLNNHLISEDDDFTWYDEFNFPIETDLFSRADLYTLWSMTLTFEVHPFALDLLKNGYVSEAQFIENFNNSKEGMMKSYKKGIICTVEEKKLFSYIEHLCCDNDNGDVFIEKLNGDILETAFLYGTGQLYKAYQITSSLIPNGCTSFYVERQDEPNKNSLKMLLNQELHQCFKKKSMQSDTSEGGENNA